MKRWILAACSVVALALPAHAEFYVAGQIGAHLPGDLSNGELTGGGLGPFRPKVSDVALQDSLMYGAKFGYYFDALPWLGVETEVYNATPHVKQQTVQLTIPGLAPPPTQFSGVHQRVLTCSPLTVVGRAQLGDFEPYAGVGVALFFAHWSAADVSASDTAVGLNTQLGLRYRITPHVSAFGEWKYNMASFSYANIALLGGNVNFEGDYRAHIFAFGIGYHF
jgi:opacity protein-like surface antigen